jgi:hypothetical protein
MTKIPSVEEVVEAIRQRHIHLKANNPVGFVHLFADIKKALQDQRDAGGRERKGWKAYAVVDAEADNYLYKGFFLNRKDAEKSWENDLSGTKGLVIIEVDVYPAITPPTK